jgi:diguanylate cyclase (GGDEF)-like protein
VEPARGIAAAPSLAQDGSEREALLRVAAAAAGAHDLEEVLEVAAEEARAAIGAASLSVSRWERDQRVLRTVINVGELGPDEERYPAAEIHPLAEDPNAERLIVEGRAYFNSVDSPELDEVSARRLMRLGKESEVGVPILVEGESWGEVYATTAPGQPRFRGEDVRFLETVAGQLAVAIGRAELFSRVSRLAYEDPLTGLANRRALTDALSTLPRPLALVMIDLDNFKLANTLYGHVGGDRVLCRVAEVLRRVTRAGDLVARLGGDEFALLVAGASEVRLRDLSERIVVAIREADTGLSPPGYRLTASVGYALVEGDGDADSLLESADRRLRRAKGEGKDRWDAGSEVDVHAHAT